MENNEKLLEAARMIQEHCGKNCILSQCIFSTGGTCCPDACIFQRGLYGLGIPATWKIPQQCRWTSADKAIAAGLKANGYNSVTRMHSSETVLVMGRSQTALELGKSFFANLQLGDVVNLDDIIGEG